MNSRWKKGAAALATVLMLQTPAFAAGVTVDGSPLEPGEGWIEGGTSYITLHSYAGLTGRNLTWDGAQARLTGGELELTARPGDLYITANGRPLYVAGGVRVVDGRLTLPLRVVAQAAGDGLAWDGPAATARLTTGQSQPPTAHYNAEDLYWLARVISAESRGEPLLGQIAVGNVVLNRVKSPKYPSTIKGVVFDTRNGVQFEPVSNGTIYQEPTSSALLAAKLCLEGADVVGDCMYFYAPALSPGTWIVNNCTYVTTIGCHRFFR